MDRRILIISLLFLILSWRITSIGVNTIIHSHPRSISEFDELEPARSKITEMSGSMLPQPQAGLLSGIVFGLKSDLPTEFNEALKNTSTIHIVVASGQNLTLLSFFLLKFSLLFGRRRLLVVSIGILTAYAMLTGLQLPIVRALIMVITIFLAQLFWREADSWFVLLLTGLFMLIFNPFWLFSISFQLSFMATVGVLIVAPEMSKLFNFLPDIIKQDFVATFCAQLLTLPIIIYNFHQVSVLSLVVNALVLWTVPVIMISGSLLLFLSFISAPLGSILAFIPNTILTYFIYVINFFNQSWAIVLIKNSNLTIWLGYYILIVALFLALKKRNQKTSGLDYLWPICA